MKGKQVGPNDRRSTRPGNVEIENSMRRPQIGKRPKKKKNPLKEADSKLFGIGNKRLLPVLRMFTAALQ